MELHVTLGLGAMPGATTALNAAVLSAPFAFRWHDGQVDRPPPSRCRTASVVRAVYLTAAMTTSAAPFELAFDRKAKLLRWTMRGFWTMADVAAFGRAMHAMTQQMGAPPHVFDGLCDSRDFPVQNREVSDALGEIDRIGSATRRGRIAIVVGSTMNKLQVQRTLRADGIRVFMSLSDAEAWLQGKTTDLA